MKFSIKIFLNRIPENYEILKDFELARLYHLKHGIELKFTFIDSDIGGLVSYCDKDSNRCLLLRIHNLLELDSKDDANIFVFDQGEWATAPGSKFPLKPETPNGCCYLTNGKPFINVGAYIFDHKNGQTWIQIAHEIMHALRQSANVAGIPVGDVMDTYRENSNPDSLTGNFAQQWFLLQPFIKISEKNDYLFLKNLYQGMIDTDVTELQRRLAILALYNANFDSNFGPKTLQAVKAYQRAKGLVSDGVVGPKTRALLNN